MRRSSTLEVSFAFGPFRLIPSQQLLVCNNLPVKLGGRALDILHLLVMQAGKEVSKDALIDFAWPNVFVDGANLKVHISSLRRALMDTLPQATYIATVAGRGYQFVADVQRENIELAGLQDGIHAATGKVPDLSPLIGRQVDIEGVAHAIDFAKLVTLVGPGGVGKTSLAIAVAHRKRDQFPDGTCFVDLSSTDNPALVPHLVAGALGIRGDLSDLISAVVQHLQHKRILVILDNCEHLPHAVAAIAGRLVEAKILGCLLATSRMSLGVSNENVQRVEPLPYPAHLDGRSATEALSYPAVKLFALRAFEAADYQLIDGDVDAVVRLCERLDGLPLAIEIAAAKLDQFSPTDLLESVSHHISILGKGKEATHPRHKTLWATLDWSYQLLSVHESTIFRLLSVFAGSFAWIDVAGMARLVQYDPYQSTTALCGLVAKSLLSATIDGEQLHYRLLESTRSYAAERLLASPFAPEAHRCHAQLVFAFFEKSDAEWAWVDNRVWRAHYETRMGDLRKALDWCFSQEGDSSLGVDLTIVATRLWDEQASILEELPQVERALIHCGVAEDAPEKKAKLGRSRAWSMNLSRRSCAEKDGAWSTAHHLAELSRDTTQQLLTMCGQALFFLWTGRNEESLTLLDDVTRRATRAEDRALLFDVERLRACAEISLGRLLDAQSRNERLADDLAKGISPSQFERYQMQSYVTIHGQLAYTYWLTGKPEGALAMADEVVLKTGAFGQMTSQSTALVGAALPLALFSGDIAALQRYSSILGNILDHKSMGFWELQHRFYRAAHQYTRGNLTAIDEMRSVIEELIRDGFLIRIPMYLSVLADALLKQGKAVAADEAIEQALQLQRQTKEICWWPELLRLKARTLAASGNCDLARTVLQKARETAIMSGARSLELRIVNDIVTMAVAEGTGEKEKALLAALYRTFEGQTATEDLRISARLLSADSVKHTPVTSKHGTAPRCHSRLASIASSQTRPRHRAVSQTRE